MDIQFRLNDSVSRETLLFTTIFVLQPMLIRFMETTSIVNRQLIVGRCITGVPKARIRGARFMERID